MVSLVLEIVFLETNLLKFEFSMTLSSIWDVRRSSMGKTLHSAFLKAMLLQISWVKILFHKVMLCQRRDYNLSPKKSKMGWMLLKPRLSPTTSIHLWTKLMNWIQSRILNLTWKYWAVPDSLLPILEIILIIPKTDLATSMQRLKKLSKNIRNIQRPTKATWCKRKINFTEKLIKEPWPETDLHSLLLLKIFRRFQLDNLEVLWEIPSWVHHMIMDLERLEVSVLTTVKR